MTNDQRDDKIIEIHTVVTTLAAEAQEDRRLTAEVRKAVFGNGNPGIKMKVDRLERSDKTKCKFYWAIGLSVLGLIGRLVYNSIVTG